jgi:hypothetical protein
MPLVNVSLSINPAALPADVRSFLREADRRIERFNQEAHIPGFVPSDYATAYSAIHALAADGIAPGNLFCEWGSGFGVVACLAAMVGFDACGIEIESELVDSARQLADDFAVPVEFLRGSFIPEGSNVSVDANDGFAWLTIDESGSHEELGLDPADFDVVFAYPWPDEECVVASLFERHAAVGALLLTYHGGETLRVRRKVGSKGRTRSRSR